MNRYTFSIQQPCNASWAEMTPVERGKYCQQCEKVVVDFSGMTDAEVVSYYERHGKVCGRFLHSQLDRDMHAPTRRKFLPAAILAGALSLMVPERVKAQVVVKGIVMDKNRNPLPGATILAPEYMGLGDACKADGSFVIKVNTGVKDSVKLKVMLVGYNSQEMTLPVAALDNELVVRLEENMTMLGGPTVISAVPAGPWKRVKMRFRQWFWMIGLLVFVEAKAQRIDGTITDMKGMALPGVGIHQKGTTNGTVTNKEGCFDLLLKEGYGDSIKLMISFLSFVTIDTVLFADRLQLPMQLRLQQGPPVGCEPASYREGVKNTFLRKHH